MAEICRCIMHFTSKRLPTRSYPTFWNYYEIPESNQWTHTYINLYVLFKHLPRCLYTSMVEHRLNVITWTDPTLHYIKRQMGTEIINFKVLERKIWYGVTFLGGNIIYQMTFQPKVQIDLSKGSFPPSHCCSETWPKGCCCITPRVCYSRTCLA